jgi:hypothetical protein
VSVRTRIEPLDRDVQAIIDEDLSPRGRSLALAAFAREELAKAQAQNRSALARTPAHETFVDGRAGAVIDTVKPDGTVVFEFELIEEVLTFVAELLVTHSPVREGVYAASHVLLADGIEVLEGERAPVAREYIFLNAQPYARKIERGLSPQAPDGVYEGVAAIAAARFGNVARIRFGYRSIRGGALSEWAARTTLQSHSPSRNMAGSKRTDWLTRQPAIVIATGR